jgi:hypothetical protein
MRHGNAYVTFSDHVSGRKESKEHAPMLHDATDLSQYCVEIDNVLKDLIANYEVEALVLEVKLSIMDLVDSVAQQTLDGDLFTSRRSAKENISAVNVETHPAASENGFTFATSIVKDLRTTV